MERRELLAFSGGAAVAWPIAARVRQRAIPVTSELDSGSA